MWRVIVALVSTMALIGCTTMKPLDVTRPASIGASVEVGDRVWIRTRAGQSLDLKVTAKSHDALTGRDAAGKHWKVPFDQIDEISAQKISGWKTAAASTLGVALVAAILLMVSVVAVSRAIEDSSRSD